MNHTLHTSRRARRAFSARTTLAAAIVVLSVAGSVFDQPFVCNIFGAPAEAAPKGADGKTALMVAAERGDLQGVKRQLAAGANINATSKQTLEGVQYRELAGEETGSYAVDRSIVDKLGHQTALMFAIKGGHLEVMQHLLDAGADVNAGGGVYCEPETELDSCVLVPKAIGWAALGERPDMIELLLQKGAKAKDGLLGVAAAGGKTDIIKLLLKHKAPADQGLKAAAAYGQTEAVRLLLDAGAKIDAREDDSCGKTALVHAAEGGHTETVRLLLARGADKNVKSYIDELGACDGDGTALDYATRNGHTQTVNVLKGGEAPTASAAPAPSAEAATPAKSTSWIEALRRALKPSAPAKTQPDSSAANTRLAAAKRAVAAGADAKALRQELSNVIDNCPAVEITMGEEDCACLARAYTPAAAEDRLEAVRFLLDNGVNVNQKNDYDVIPLEETLGLLAQMNFSCGYEDMGINTKDNIATASEGISKIATLLVSRGANFKNSRIDYGSGVAAGILVADPLGIAAKYGNADLVRILIEKGADVEGDECPALAVIDRDLACSSVLELAEERGNAAIVKLLLEKGAKKDRKMKAAGGKKGAKKRK